MTFKLYLLFAHESLLHKTLTILKEPRAYELLPKKHLNFKFIEQKLHQNSFMDRNHT